MKRMVVDENMFEAPELRTWLSQSKGNIELVQALRVSHVDLVSLIAKKD